MNTRAKWCVAAQVTGSVRLFWKVVLTCFVEDVLRTQPIVETENALIAMSNSLKPTSIR